MDEFVTEIKQNIENKPDIAFQRKNSKYVEILRIILPHDSKIRILESKCNQEGDVRFEIPLYSIGLNYEKMLNYHNELMSDYMINFLGELFVREHLGEFVKLLTNLKGDYARTVNSFEHRGFGMRMYRDQLSFIFHISFIQNVLTEEFKYNIK